MKFKLEAELELKSNGLCRESFTDYSGKLMQSTVNKVNIGAANLYLKAYAEEYIKNAKKNNMPMEDIKTHLETVSDTFFQRGLTDEKGAAIVQELLEPMDVRFIYSELISANEELFPEAVVLTSDIASATCPKAVVYGSIVQDVFDHINTTFDKLLTVKIQ